jgi:CheY-like chemotaxis protein
LDPLASKSAPSNEKSSAVNEIPTILLVEDDAPVQELVEEALDQRGYSVTVSSGAEETLALLNSGVVKYRALLTDVHVKGAKTDGSWQST